MMAAHEVQEQPTALEPVLEAHDDQDPTSSVVDLNGVATNVPGSRVLIVDDTLSNLLSVGALLEELNVPFSLAQSGKTALSIVKTRMK